MRRLYWPVLRRLRRLGNLCCGLSKPGLETRLAESCVIARNQCSLADSCPRVKRFGISDHFAGIFECCQAPPDQFIQAKLFWAPNFDDAVHRRANCNSCHGGRDIVGSHWLEKHRWQMHVAVNDGNGGDAFDEFKELRRVNDGVWDGRELHVDQLFLSDLGPEVTDVLEGSIVMQ